ncbi:hypothetical protein JW756_00855 [Candidatus Woesearchaeota archaeon]|nr:hypothetical protein [Candidatus Woesearchaeota archaeon]
MKAFEGNTLDEITKSVGKSVLEDKFEAVVKENYPNRMSEADRLALGVALYNNMQTNRYKYFKEHHNIEIKTFQGVELEKLPIEKLCAANNAVYKINEPYTKAMEFLKDYKQ